MVRLRIILGLCLLIFFNVSCIRISNVFTKNKSVKYRVLEKSNVSIDLINNEFRNKIVLKYGLNKQIIDLDKEGIPTKTIDGVLWANNDFACVLVWWSQAQSRHVFLPMKKRRNFIYINKSIEEMDSVNNNIVYIDTVYWGSKIVFSTENLLTRKVKKQSVLIDDSNSVFPYHDKIAMSKDSVIINIASERVNIDIREIY